jgi:hypothetical protein
MLAFYADDAGKKDNNAYVIAAEYVGLVAQWERFCADWRLQLASVGLPEFHASEFFPGYGIFAGWNDKKREAEKTRLLTSLAEIIARTILFAVSVVSSGCRVGRRPTKITCSMKWDSHLILRWPYLCPARA